MPDAFAAPEALSALLGAVIGAMAAIGAQWLSIHHTRKADLRRERVELVAKFWEACDRVWRHERDLTYTIYDLQASREAGHRERLVELDQRRLEEIAGKATAVTDSGFLLAQIRLLHPALEKTATALASSSQSFTIEDHDKVTTAREAKRAAFEAKAQRMLG